MHARRGDVFYKMTIMGKSTVRNFGAPCGGIPVNEGALLGLLVISRQPGLGAARAATHEALGGGLGFPCDEQRCPELNQYFKKMGI